MVLAIHPEMADNLNALTAKVVGLPRDTKKLYTDAQTQHMGRPDDLWIDLHHPELKVDDY